MEVATRYRLLTVFTLFQLLAATDLQKKVFQPILTIKSGKIVVIYELIWSKS